MISINIICCGKIKEKYWRDAIDEYSKRLQKFAKFNIIEIPDEKVPDRLSNIVISNIKNIEANKMIAKLPKDTYLIALDVKGTQYSSEEFAKKISDYSVKGISSITFIIGGTLGIGENLMNLVNEKISFSKMTFPHQLMRVLFVEQLFRAFKIINNETYHR